MEVLELASGYIGNTKRMMAKTPRNAVLNSLSCMELLTSVFIEHIDAPEHAHWNGIVIYSYRKIV